MIERENETSFPLGSKKKKRPVVAHPSHPPFHSYFDASRMDYYKLVINDWSDFICVNNHQVIENYKLPAYKISSKLTFYFGGWQVY